MRLLLLTLWFASVGCGRQADVYTTGPSAPVDAEFTLVVLPLVKANCAGCHDGVKEPALNTPAAVKAAKGKLASKAMPPPPRTLSDADRQTLLAYASK